MYYEIKKLLRITGRSLRFVILLIMRSPVDLCMTVIQGVFLQHAYNAIWRYDSRNLSIVCFTFIIAELCIFLYNGIVWGIYSSFVVRMEGILRISLFEKILKLSCQRVEARAKDEWITRLNTDVQMPFSQPVHLPHAVNAILRILVSAIILWYMNPAVLGWVMLFALPHIISSHILVARAMPKLNERCLEAVGKNTGDLSLIIASADISALYDGKDYMMQRFEKSSMDLLQSKIKILRKNALNTAIGIFPFGLGGYFVLLIVCGRWISMGSLSFGDLAAAFQYRLGFLMGSMMLVNCMISIQASMAGIRRINETMYEEGEDTYE